MSKSVTVEAAPALVNRDESALRVEVISEEPSFLSLEPAWNRLVEEAGIDHPFLTFAWVRTWWECFGSGKKLHILVVKAGDEVIGIAPLALTYRRMYGIKLRCLEFLSNVHTPRFDVIVSRRPPEVYRALWQHLQKEGGLWDLLLLCQVPEGSPTLEQLPRLAEENRHPLGCWRSGNSPYLTIQDDWETYWKRTKAKHRQNIRNRLRRLSELGPVALEAVSSRKELETALEEGLRLEGVGWKDQEGTSIRSQPAVRLFYTLLAEKFAELDWLRLYFLRVNGRRMAFHYSLSFGGKVFLLKPGYDPAYAPYSPANLLCFFFLENAFRTGLKEFDLLGIEEDWKLQWTQNTRPHYWLFIFSKGPLASTLYFLKFRLRPLLQQRKSYRALRSAVVALKRRFGSAEAAL
jgi:CelD/BcsL family acetyltransferase involved in cellulose biosynthesis